MQISSLCAEVPSLEGDWNQTVVDGQAQNRSHNGVHEITEISVAGEALTYRHDPRGNLVLDPQAGQSYEWDFDNQLSAANKLKPKAIALLAELQQSREDITNDPSLSEKKRDRLLAKLAERIGKIKTQELLVSYRYDALGRRVSKAEAKSEMTTYYVSSGQQVWSEVELEKGAVAPTISTSFVYGTYIDDVVEIFDHVKAKPFYSHSNHLYSVAAITNSKGRVVESKAYDAYGGVVTINNKGNEIDSKKSRSPFGFTGRRIDSETGLMYFRARYYSAELGRFIGRDPLGYVDGMSLYRGYFVPIHTDPLGLWCWDRFIGNTLINLGTGFTVMGFCPPCANPVGVVVTVVGAVASSVASEVFSSDDGSPGM